MGPDLYGDLRQVLLEEKAAAEGLRSGAQPALLDDLAAFVVDHAQAAVFVAEVQSRRQLRPFLLAIISHGPILLSWATIESVTTCRPHRVLRRGSAFSSHLQCHLYETTTEYQTSPQGALHISVTT